MWAISKTLIPTLPNVAGAGFEPASEGYEPPKEPDSSTPLFNSGVPTAGIEPA